MTQEKETKVTIEGDYNAIKHGYNQGKRIEEEKETKRCGDTLKDKIVGSNGYEYAFLYKDVVDFIKKVKEDLRNMSIINYDYYTVSKIVDKHSGGIDEE